MNGDCSYRNNKRRNHRKEGKSTMTIIQTIITLFQLALAGVFVANIRRERPKTEKAVNLISLALVAITIYTVWR